MQEIKVKTGRQNEMIDITAQVQQSVGTSGVHSGVCTVFIPHTTAGVTINENADPAVVRDILMETNKIIPQSDGYAHMEGNSAAHIKATLTGSSESVPISGGALLLGTWQGVYLCEYDGPRSRTVVVTITS